MNSTNLEAPTASRIRGKYQDTDGITAPEELEAELAERPTTFELAQLAAILATRPESSQIPPGEVVLEALQLWDAALKVRLTEKQEREIWHALFLDDKQRWELRLKSYVGDKYGLYDLLSEARYQVESEVLPNLFPDDIPDARREKFAELVQYAQGHAFFSPTEGALQHTRGMENQDARQLQASCNGQDLLAGRFNALAVRMLVEAEQERRGLAMKP